jgi:SAM-dependent methyltransferase
MSLLTACRACGGPPPQPFLDLGLLPFANALPRTPSGGEPRHPLVVGFCDRCTLVQLVHGLPSEAVFDADYPYFSSYSEGLVAHARAHVDGLVESRGLDSGSLVVEIASNDGYLLQHVLRHGVQALGVEPTPGPAAAARERGVPTVAEFFGSAQAAALVEEHGQADVVVANNVLAHVPDPADFVRGLAALVRSDGLVTIENPSVGSLLAHAEWDTIYHEHMSYLSTLSVAALAEAAGLRLVHVEPFPALHGGTLRWHLAHRGTPSPEATAQLAAERAQGLHRFETYAAFDAVVRGSQAGLRALLDDLREGGARIAAYGAAAKGATLLGACGIDVGTIDFVVDRNTWKQGRFLPGTGIPVEPVEALVEHQPSHTLLLAWNVADEVVRQQAGYLAAGGHFLVPVPEARVLA